MGLMDTFVQAMDNRKVGIVEFCEDSRYCSKPLYPRQAVFLKLIFLEEMEGWEEDILTEWINGINVGGEVEISPNIRERRDKLRGLGYPHFREIYMIGGRRSSKGHMTGLAYAYKIWNQIALGNPQEFHGIDRHKQIYFTTIATSEAQAIKYQFADIKGAVRSCKALEPYVERIQATEIKIKTPADLAREATEKRLAAHKNNETFCSLIARASAANSSSVRGEATMVLDLDEMAHMMEGVNTKSSAEEIFEAAKPALDQFGKEALIFGNSSPYTKIGKFYESYCQAMNIDINGNKVEEDIDFRQIAFQFPSWELYRGWEKKKGYSFKGAQVLSPDEDEGMALEEKKNPEKFKVERRAQFAEVIEGFLDPELVDRCFEPWDGRHLRTKSNRAGLGPEYLFKIHCDPATTDKNFGMVVAHSETMYNEITDREELHCVIDLAHAWLPVEAQDRTLDYINIQEELVEYAQAFMPYDISFDQFQSNAAIGHLRKHIPKFGFSCHVHEVTATNPLNLKRAEIAKTAINLGRVHIPDDTRFTRLLKNELKFLQKKNNKVEHQETGPVQTKDIADCLFECIRFLIGHELMGDFSQPLAMGGQGGYNQADARKDFRQQWYGAGNPNRQGSIEGISRTRNAQRYPGKRSSRVSRFR